jgi:hypothetical protein
MRNLIYRILKEYTEDIQKVYFDGFSDPILIPQYKMYIVKFNGTSKEEKISASEKIVFIDKKTNKEYIINSDDIQKSGGSPFYISLDVLRKYYDIKFDDEFVRHKEDITPIESGGLLTKVMDEYVSNGRCKSSKCQELRNLIIKSLNEIYPGNRGKYVSMGCEDTEGFLNIFPLPNTYDDNGNIWSKLNYIISHPNSVKSLLIAYIKKYGTFEHKDFISWVNDEKDRLFKGQFFDLMLRNVNPPKVHRMGDDVLMKTVLNVFPDAKVVSSFCPTSTGENIVISSGGKRIVFQIVIPKSKKVLFHNEKFYLLFGRRSKSPMINRRADYIIIPDVAIFENSNVIVGERVWEFDNPPVYYELPFETELKKYTKII